jgi:hypothetical protein
MADVAMAYHDLVPYDPNDAIPLPGPG